MVRVADDVIASLHPSASLKETDEGTCSRIVSSIRQLKEEIRYGTVFQRREEDPGASPQAY
jgi:hypothetical protein